MTVEDNRGYKFYHEILKSPKFVTAPMVEGSELSFRLLTRKYFKLYFISFKSYFC